MTELPIAFFSIFPAYLAGALPLNRMAHELGDSPSGQGRLEVYRRFVTNRCHALLRGLFPAVEAAAQALDPFLWDVIVLGYLERWPGRHWDLNEMGATFSDHLAERAARDPQIPPYLAEIADLHFLRHRTSIHEPYEDPALTVRQYSHDVLEYAAAVKRGESRRAPDAVPSLCLVGRSMVTGEVVMLRPTLAMVLWVAKTRGTDIPRELSEQVPEEMLAEAGTQLEHRGLSRPPSHVIGGDHE